MKGGNWTLCHNDADHKYFVLAYHYHALQISEGRISVMVQSWIQHTAKSDNNPNRNLHMIGCTNCNITYQVFFSRLHLYELSKK
jgi:protein-arginine kinase activator protein McsA